MAPEGISCRRFAFQMRRYWGDLRKFIDLRMQRNQQPLFSDSELKSNMRQIAVGMKSLHEDHIIHRDLKASNVLIRLYENYQDCWVADSERSLGVLGTGFWRAPEILLAMTNRNITSDLCTQKSDVYSYAMTCYEMITGHLPFEDLHRSDYDVVLRGDSPILPETTEPWIKILLGKCWRSNPLDRPTFEDIVECIDSNFDNSLYYRYAILNNHIQ